MRSKLGVLKAAKAAQASASHRTKIKPSSGFSFVDKSLIQYDDGSTSRRAEPSTKKLDLPRWNKYHRVDSYSTDVSLAKVSSGDSPARATADLKVKLAATQIKSLTGLVCIELCAGSAKLSQALQHCGFQVLPIDHGRNAHTPRVHCVQIDLSAPGAFSLIQAVLDEPNIFYVHMAPPCGTASAARNKPIDPKLVKAGFPSPAPLRSRSEPLGLAGLSAENQHRVHQANAIYSLCAKVISLCLEKRIIFSVENPARSLFWQVPCIKHFETDSRLEDIYFHHCMHGGERDKETLWRGTKEVFACLALQCDNQHTHLPWEVKMTDGRPVFDTALESEYPSLLCANVAQAVKQVAIARGFIPPADSIKSKLSQDQLRLKLLASVGKQARGRRLPQLVSEFAAVHEVSTPVGAPVPPILPSQSFLRKFLRADEGGEVGSKKQVYIVGTRRPPEEFIKEAIKAGHPYDPGAGATDDIKKALFQILTLGPTALEEKRKTQIARIRNMAVQRQLDEERKHHSLPQHLQKILSTKKLLLFKDLLLETGFGDAKVVDELCAGFDVVGKTQPSGLLEARLRPATSTQQQLKLQAKLTKWSILSSNRKFSDDELDKEVYDITRQELEEGWLEGPHTEHTLDVMFPDGWLPVPRFGIRQGPKVRAIDDCKFPGLNGALTTVEKLRLQDTDDLCSLIAFVAKVIGSASESSRTFELDLSAGSKLRGVVNIEWGPITEIKLQGRTLDLKSAYKQAGNSAATLWSCVVAVWSADNCGFELYTSRALMFGATASVYAFNRIAKALQHLATNLLCLLCTQFFDDFPCCEPLSSSTTARTSFEDLLQILGWSWATGEKAPDFAEIFHALGNKYDITNVVKAGAFFVGNKESRLMNIADMIDEARESGSLRPSVAAELAGKLQYTSAQVFGDSIKPALRTIRARADCHSNIIVVGPELDFALAFVRDYLFTAPPRLVAFRNLSEPIFVFSDGSSEGSSHLWGVDVFEKGVKTVVAAGIVPSELISFWKQHVGRQVICQIELYPVILVKLILERRFSGRRVVFYIDNDPARDGLISGASESASSRALLYQFARSQRSSPSYNWYARVPSFSNYADAPSRGEGLEQSRALNATFCSDWAVNGTVLALLQELRC